MAAEPQLPVGELLRRYRGARGYTQEELAERARLSTRAVSDLERGVHRSPQSETLHLLAQALALPGHERDALVAAATSSRRHSAPANDQPAGRRTRRLPAPLTPLIGRERERAILAQLLQQPDVRLVTLTGPAGVGKTRLAIQSAAEATHLFPDGVVFVALAPIDDPSLVAATIAQALGIRLVSAQLAAESVAEAVRESRLLLLLDNFEQVAGAAPVVGELLVAARGIKVVVTSRAALRVQGERRFPVAPLAVPEAGHELDPASLGQVPSVALFVERALALDPAFALTVENTAAVAEICRRLDGLPLAIVLASARSAVLPPTTMLARLDHRLAVLRHGPADLPPRHQALCHALAWSYDLLSPAEQVLFRRLAVFVGGCTLEAIEAVGPAVSRLDGDLLDALEGLLDKSLLQREPGNEGEPRFTMLETLREYGLVQLAASGENDAARAQHAGYFLTGVAPTAGESNGPALEEWLVRLDREHDNLRAALRWALEGGNAGYLLRLGSALAPFWRMRGYVEEGLRWLEAALAMPDGGATRTRTKVLCAAAELANAQGDTRRAIAIGRESLALCRELGDLPGTATALHNLGWDLAAGAQSPDDYAAAGAYQEECLALQRHLGNELGEAKALHELGELARYQRDYRAAMRLLEQALRRRHELGDTEGVGWSLHCLAWAAYDQGHYPCATERAQEALVTWRKLGQQSGIAATSSLQARITWRQGDWAHAACALRESLQRWERLRHREWLAFDLQVLAGLTLTRRPGRRAAVRAARLLGAAEALRESINKPLPLHYRGEPAEIWRGIRTHLDERVLVAAGMKGRAMPADWAARYAHAVVARWLDGMWAGG